MKKSILILILAGLLTACVPTTGMTPDTDHGEEHLESPLNSAPFSENYTELESYSEIESQLSTECEISTTEATVTTVKSQSETVCTTTAVTDVQKEENHVDPTEVQQEKSTDDSSSSPKKQSMETVRKKGLDCSGLVYATLTDLGVRTSGFPSNNPVPQNYWEYGDGSAYKNCTMTYKGVTSPIEVLYDKLNADNHV